MKEEEEGYHSIQHPFSVHTNALIQLDSILLKHDNIKTDFISYQVFIKECDFFTCGIICMND